MTRTIPALAPLVLVTTCLAACHASHAGSAAAGSGGSAPDASAPDPCSLYSCDNVVDAVLVPMLVEAGFTPSTEDNGVLCRRMAIDLTGIAPTPDEVAQHCAGKTPGEMADYFMTKLSGANVPPVPAGDDATLYAPYVFVNRRWWADNFQYKGFSVFIHDLDQLVGQLYAGTIAYDELAQRALASPAFLERFGGDSPDLDTVALASNAISIFLGRQALPDEAQDFGNLWRGWTALGMYYLPDAEAEAVSMMMYGNQCPVDPKTKAVACSHFELGLDWSRCDGPLRAGCQSTVFGPYEMVPSVPSPPSSEMVEQWAVDQASHSSNLSRHFHRVGTLGPADLDAIRTPGRALVARPEFAEGFVNDALVKYLRWWRSGAYRPDYDVPAVREALAKKFRADAYDVRKLEREIVTSLLYVQAAAASPGESPLTPLWVHGPTKPLYAEAWLDTIGQAIGTPLYSCDFRYENAVAYVHYQATGIPDVLAYPAANAAFYASVLQDLGGCPNASIHADPVGIIASVARRTALASVCTAKLAPALAPDASSTFDTLVDKAFAGVGRAATADEKQTLVEAMGVMADGGCDPTMLMSCDLQTLSDSLCKSLYATALFNFY